MNTPVREGETIEGSRTMRNRPYPVLKCSSTSSTQVIDFSPWAPACTHPGAEGACTSHRSVPHSSSTDRHVQGSTLVDPWTVHTAPTRSVTTSYLCGPGFPGASPCLKRRACIQIREVNRDLRAPAHRHLVVTGSAQLHVEVAPRSTVHWWSASNVLPYPL